MLSNVINRVHKAFNHQFLEQNNGSNEGRSGQTELEAVIEAKERLAEIDFLEKRRLKTKVRLVLNLDVAVCRKVQNITHSYLTSLKNNDDLKKSIETEMYDYLRQLYTTYTLIFDELAHQNKVKLNAGEVNLILARYLNALFLMAKWRYFDDQAAPMAMWENVHKIIRLAEDLSIMNKNLFLYEFQNKETSIATILERGLMLDTLQAGNYSQLEIELADRVIRTWSNNPVISKEHEHDEHQFFIHLEGDKRPQRMRGAKSQPDFRYWKTLWIIDLIETYLCSVDTRKSLDAFNLVTMAATEDIVQLFKKLRVDWCVDGYKRQRRSEQRKPNYNKLNVSHGIEGICSRLSDAQAGTLTSGQKVEGLADELTLAYQGVLLASFDSEINLFSNENWTMIEESSKGLSVELGQNVSAWVKSGALVGYATITDTNAMTIAEIKTVKKQANGHYRVGLLKVTNQAIALDASLVQKNSDFNSVAGYDVDDGEENLSYSASFLCLLIDEGGDSKPRLIVPRNMYKPGQHYKVNRNGQDHILLAGGVMNKHQKWVCFEIGA